MASARQRQGGFTLLEMTIALTVAIIIFLVIADVARTGTYAMDHLSTTQQVEHEMKRSLDEVMGRLKVASRAGIVVESVDVNHDRVTLQIPDPGATTDPIVYGALDATGVFQPDWTVRYEVLDGVLVRRTFDEFGTQAGSDAIMCREIDNVAVVGGDTLKGFQVTSTPPLINVVIRVRTTHRDHSEFIRQESTTVHMGNP